MSLAQLQVYHLISEEKMEKEKNYNFAVSKKNPL
jgi:hypothetical protein